jgi:hypothetical protein
MECIGSNIDLLPTGTPYKALVRGRTKGMAGITNDDTVVTTAGEIGTVPSDVKVSVAGVATCAVCVVKKDTGLIECYGNDNCKKSYEKIFTDTPTTAVAGCGGGAGGI